MNRVDNSSWRRLGSAAHRGGMLLSVATLMALIGCENDYVLKQGDPLVGIHGPPAGNVPAASVTQPAQTAASGVPPLPATHSLPSQAALASGTTPTPESPRDLRIGGASIVPASLPGSGTVRGAAPAGAVLEGVEPVPESTSRLLPVASSGPGVQRAVATGPGVVAAPTSIASTATFEQLQQMLKQRGVTWQRLETWGDKGQWKFRCSLPVPNSRNVNRTYETDTPLPYDPLTAMKAVLDKIDQDRR